MRLGRSIAFVSAAIAGLVCSQICMRGAAPPGLFHPDAQNIANRLYRQLHLRMGSGGEEYGGDALDPLLWRETNYLLARKSRLRTLDLADEFLRTHAERQITDPTKRAILQRDVWAVFDWADQPDAPNQAQRRELMARLALLVRRLALSQDELAHLPDTYALALQDHEFPAIPSPTHHNEAFLPPDLFDSSGPWVCLGAPNHDLAAPLHDSSFTARSVFLAFARLPGGRNATLAYFKQLAETFPLFVPMQEPGWSQPMEVWNPQIPQFPVGTEFALVRKMALPDRDGHLVLTPVTESVQIRIYTDIPKVSPMASRDVALAQRFQEPSEIVLSHALLFAKRGSGLRGVTATDDSFLIFPAMSNGFDAFEDKNMGLRAGSPFAACKGCHLGPGIQSVMSFSFRGNPNEGPVFSPRLSETTPRSESEKVLEWAQTQKKWTDLLRLWSSETTH